MNSLQQRQKILSRIDRLLDNPSDWAGALSGSGPVFELEAKFKALTGHRYALCMANATLAIWQICGSLELTGREIICSPITWGGMLTGPLLTKSKIRFADVNTVTACPTLDTLCPVVSKRTKALLINDTFGYPGIDKKIQKYADDLGFVTIQDCSESFGAFVDGKHTGAFADVAVFSLGPLKPLSAGEGAVVVTSNKKLYERLIEFTQHPQRMRRDIPWTRNQFALNCRLSPVAAVIANERFFPVLDVVAEERNRWRSLAQKLVTAGLSYTPAVHGPVVPGYSRFTFMPAAGARDKIVPYLKSEQLRYRLILPPCIQPIYLDPYFQKHYQKKDSPHLPLAQFVCGQRVQLVKMNSVEDQQS